MHPRCAGNGIERQAIATPIFSASRFRTKKQIAARSHSSEANPAAGRRSVRDYGNRMGIPTVNGAVYFDDRYLGNPLVFAAAWESFPETRLKNIAQRRPHCGYGRTDRRDGIHGATFSSAELTDTHADEFSHAVQIGNAITQKKMADVILAARDRNFHRSNRLWCGRIEQRHR